MVRTFLEHPFLGMALLGAAVLGMIASFFEGLIGFLRSVDTESMGSFLLTLALAGILLGMTVIFFLVKITYPLWRFGWFLLSCTYLGMLAAKGFLISVGSSPRSIHP